MYEWHMNYITVNTHRHTQPTDPESFQYSNYVQAPEDISSVCRANTVNTAITGSDRENYSRSGTFDGPNEMNAEFCKFSSLTL